MLAKFRTHSLKRCSYKNVILPPPPPPNADPKPHILLLTPLCNMLFVIINPGHDL